MRVAMIINGKCCIFGGGSLYRLPVYNLLAKKIDCDFYIGVERDDAGIKAYDYSELTNFKGEILHKRFGKFFWQKGGMKTWGMPYEYYFVGGAYCLTSWVMILLSFFSKKKVVSWSHGLYGRESGLRKLVKVVFFKACYQCLVYNQRAKDLMIQCGINGGKIHVVYNSLDTDHILSIRSKLEKTELYKKIFANDNPNLVYIGRITQRKRLDLVLQAMKILLNKGTPVNFLVVGKDIDGVGLEKMAGDMGLSTLVHLYGQCYDDDIIGEMFYNADVCVAPGNAGLIVINALSFGCPVITHDNLAYQTPEFEAIMPGVTGDFFHHDDADDLSAKIEAWAYNKSENDRERIMNNAFKEVDGKWNIYSEVSVFEGLYGHRRK